MNADVTFESAPNKFEAGTGNLVDAVGLGAALDHVERIVLSAIPGERQGEGCSLIAAICLQNQTGPFVLPIREKAARLPPCGEGIRLIRRQ